MKPIIHTSRVIGQPDENLLEIAIQTVLHKNKDHLSLLATDCNEALLVQMAQEINHRVIALHEITNSVVGYMDRMECP